MWIYGWSIPFKSIAHTFLYMTLKSSVDCFCTIVFFIYCLVMSFLCIFAVYFMANYIIYGDFVNKI